MARFKISLAVLACGIAARGQEIEQPGPVEWVGEYEDHYAGQDPEAGKGAPAWFATRTGVRCRFDDVTLDELLAGFRRASGVPIEVDAPAFPKGLPDTRVSLRLGPVTLVRGLEAGLEKAGLAVVVQQGRLLVTTPERAKATVAMEVFDTRNILETDVRFAGIDDWGALTPDRAALVKLAEKAARPDGAAEPGAAKATVTEFGLLFVEDVPPGLARVREFFESARPAGGAVTAAGETENLASLENWYDRRLVAGWHEASLHLVDVAFKDASLITVLRDFRVFLDIPVVLDSSARTEAVKAHRFTLESRGLTVRNALAKLLAPAGLELVIEAQGLRVADATAAAALPAVEIYDVRRLLDDRYPGKDPEDGPSTGEFESDVKNLVGPLTEADSLSLCGEFRFIVSLTPALRRKFEDWMVEELGKGPKK